MSSCRALDDLEQKRLPGRFETVVDAHVHLFPDPIFQAIWRWFDQFAWPIRYKLTSSQIIEFLTSRGVARVLGLHYAHKPGMARQLNRYMAGLCRDHPQLIGTATVFPGEKNAVDILKEAFQMGLTGVKLHAHVQYFAMDDSVMYEIYECCADHNRPLIMHVGREPKNPDYLYKRDPYETCKAEKLERILINYPSLKICVPHIGADEFDQYRRLLECYDNLWVDTAMVLVKYVPNFRYPKLLDLRSNRVMFGTDFPNIPYAWDTEIRQLEALQLTDDFLVGILERNASEFLSIKM
ncbi:MAG: amidohydrolase [Deltaproteobacteria bacterium]|nr:amidohydrolase [Deltaproteobacteria bacterium]